jgi:hypothetical protein
VSPRLSLTLLSLVALLTLGWAASLHGLHFVDLVGFSRRARDLTEGRPPSDGLYPLGFPGWLALAHATGVGLLPAARLLSVGAGTLLCALVARRLGVAAAAWLLAQAVFLRWGSSEGTDLPAAALSLAALFFADRPRLAGLCLGLALSLRWTAAAWVLPLALLLRPGDRLQALPGLAAGLLPHLIGCAWSGTFVLPDQSLNLAIASGPGAPPPMGVGGVLGRVPRGLAEAAPFLLPDVLSRVGAALGLLAALLPGRSEPDRALRRLAAALLLGGVLHTLGLAAVFANARLALPVTLVALGGFGLAAARLGAQRPTWGRPVAVALGVAALLVATRSVPAVRLPPAGAELVLALAAARAGCPDANAPTLANNAMVHSEQDGWLVPAVQLGGLRVTPRTTPAALGRIADAAGLRVLVLDPVRARGQAGLTPLVKGDATEVDGWRRCADRPLRIWTRAPAPVPS